MKKHSFNAALVAPPWSEMYSAVVQIWAVASIADCMDALIDAAGSQLFRRHQMNAASDLAHLEQRRAAFLECLSSQPMPFQQAVDVARKQASTDGTLDFNRSAAEHRSAPMRWVAELILEGGALDFDEDDLVFFGDRHSIDASAYNIALQMGTARSGQEHKLETLTFEVAVDVLKQMGVTAAPSTFSSFGHPGAALPASFTSAELLAAAKFMDQNQLRRSRIADPDLYREMMLSALHGCINAHLVRDEDDEEAIMVAAASTMVLVPDDILAAFRAMLAEYY